MADRTRQGSAAPRSPFKSTIVRFVGGAVLGIVAVILLGMVLGGLRRGDPERESRVHGNATSK
jgi:hypothetical protein